MRIPDLIEFLKKKRDLSNRFPAPATDSKPFDRSGRIFLLSKLIEGASNRL